MSRKNTVRIIALLILVIVVSLPWIADTGLFIMLRGNRYDRDYNEERLKIGQPIIEDYFVKKPHKDKHLNIWSDTTESHVHLDKSYYTNGFGELMYEIDSYRPPIDTVWLMNQLGITKLDTLDFWTFERTFYLNKGVDSYQILYRLKRDTYRTSTLSMHVGDSLYQTLK